MGRLATAILTWFVAVSLLLSTVPVSPAAAAPPDGSAKIERALLEKVQANPNRRYDIIVSMQPGKGKEARRAVEAVGGRHGRDLPIAGGSSGAVSGQGILALTRNPGVFRVHEDAPVVLMGTPVATVSTLAVRAPDAWALGYTGKGVGVAVLDSGVAPHSDLVSPANRIIASFDVSKGAVSPSDSGGHGTHVAGIIAGNGAASGGARQGIAPESNIISVKVTNDSGLATYSSVIAGVQWVLRNKQAYNIRVLNVSLGSPATTSYKDDPVNAALEVAWFSGIVVVTAAGNGGPNAGTITSPGNDPYLITVGAFDDKGTATHADDSVPDFSSRGPTAFDNLPKPDISAPGRKVVSLRTPGSYLDRLFPDRVVDNQYFRLTGTSMAAPVVAGVAALILSKDPGLSPNQVKKILTHTAQNIGSDVNSRGSGAVDALAAVKFGGKDSANRGNRPSDIFASAVYPLVKGSPLTWRNPHLGGQSWANFTWDTLPWNNFTWDNFTWDNVTWDNFTWDNFTWDNFTWDNFTWDNFTWDNVTWDNFTWDNYTWDNFTWDNFTWDTYGKLD